MNQKPSIHDILGRQQNLLAYMGNTILGVRYILTK